MNKLSCLLPVTLALVLSDIQVSIIETHNFNSLSVGIPDGDPNGVTNVQTFTSAITNIESVEVSLNITGGFNGDLYVYLQHELGLAMLLNRTGRTAGNSFGYDDDGFNVTFADGAPDNIHTYRDQVTPLAGSPLTGTWQPDGRTTDPDLVVDTDASTAVLASLVGGDANGSWTLFMADLSTGAVHTLESWSLSISGSTVPEASEAVLVMLAASGLLFDTSAQAAFVSRPKPLLSGDMNRVFPCLAAIATLGLHPGNAASVVENYDYNGINQLLPDGNPSGYANLQSIAGSAITSIEDISVTLNISGSFNGDLYGYLQHGSGLAILLNRVGRTNANSFGYDNDGFQVTLNDLGGFDDIHGEDSGSGLLSGTFGSDGRITDPNSVLAGDSRDALLNTFLGTDANGDWTLFLADLSGGESHTLDSWSMEITGVPESGTATLLLLGTALLARRRR